jgi:hypothetical protein
MTVLVGLVGYAVKSLVMQPESFKLPRLASTDRPDINGIWQVLNTANWDIEDHPARPGLATIQGPAGPVPGAPVLALGAVGVVPAGLGVVEGGKVPYLPASLQRKRENFEHALNRDPEVKCYMPGIPRATYMPFPFQIVQSTNKIMMIYEFASARRVIHFDSVPPPPTETWMGHSIGRWEGDTLVVDVTSQVADTWFDRSGNFHSDALHVVERFTPVNANHLEYEVLIEDPKVFSRPWTMRMPLYRRVEPDMQLAEFKCVEFVEELMYGYLRKQPLTQQWSGNTLTVSVSRFAPPR